MRPASFAAALIALLLSAAGPAAAAVDYVPRMERVAACNWDRPGHNPFMGDVVAAIDRYSDIPTLVRIKLKQRMQARRYDDLVDIRRDDITGRERYDPTIRDMHFGLDRVCRQVTRERWTAAMHERGLVYCEQGYCILVPTVCRNVSRVERRPTLVAGATAGEIPEGGLALTEPVAELTVAGLDDLATPRPPTATSSFAEAVAGAVVPLWPSGSEAGPEGDDPPGAAPPPGLEPPPWWPPTGGGGFPGGGGSAPVTAVPEPSTWVSLLAGLLLLVSAQRRRRRCPAPH